MTDRDSKWLLLAVVSMLTVLYAVVVSVWGAPIPPPKSPPSPVGEWDGQSRSGWKSKVTIRADGECELMGVGDWSDVKARGRWSVSGRELVVVWDAGAWRGLLWEERLSWRAGQWVGVNNGHTMSRP